MKLPILPLSLLLVFVCSISAVAQKRKPMSDSGKAAVVIDENLSVLRARPSLFAPPIQRMRRGRRVQIIGSADGDGVRFYKVTASRRRSGWLQSDAVFARRQPSDEERLVKLVQASSGFDQIELAARFLEMYPSSSFRPAILLLVGDLLEDAAVKLSRDANSRLSRREMTASGAPLHSYYLNFNMLDRYRRLGAVFLFDSTRRAFHYNGATWAEIVRKHAASPERDQAQKRLESLRSNFEGRATN